MYYNIQMTKTEDGMSKEKEKMHIDRNINYWNLEFHFLLLDGHKTQQWS